MSITSNGDIAIHRGAINNIGIMTLCGRIAQMALARASHQLSASSSRSPLSRRSLWHQRGSGWRRASGARARPSARHLIARVAALVRTRSWQHRSRHLSATSRRYLRSRIASWHRHWRHRLSLKLVSRHRSFAYHRVSSRIIAAS